MKGEVISVGMKEGMPNSGLVSGESEFATPYIVGDSNISLVLYHFSRYILSLLGSYQIHPAGDRLIGIVFASGDEAIYILDCSQAITEER